MASTGIKYPTVATTASETPWTNNDWTNPSYATASDANYAAITAATYDTPDESYVLKLTGFDFSAIPADAIITGITVTVAAWYANGTVSGDLCQLLDTSAAKVGTNKWSGLQALTTSVGTIYTLGGTLDTWGNALTAAWVKNSNFGVALGFRATGDNADVFVNYARMDVEYVVPVVPTPNVLSATITGRAPSLFLALSSSPNVRSVAFAGQAPSLAIVPVVSMQVSWAQLDVMAPASGTRKPGAGALAFAGLAPTAPATYNYYPAPSSYAVSIEGRAPVAAVVTPPVVIDVPCLGRQDAAWNPNDKHANLSLSNSDRTINDTYGSSSWWAARGKVGRATGKWYFEIRIDAVGAGSQFLFGLADATTSLSTGMYLGSFPNSYGWGTTGAFTYKTGTGTIHGTLGSASVNGDVYGVAFDADSHRVDIYKNGVLLSGRYADGLEATTFYPAISLYDNTQQATINVAAADLAYSPPSGYAAWGAEYTPVALAGAVPTVVSSDNRIATPDVRALSLAGAVPAADVSYTFTPGCATLLLAGQPPASLATLVIPPGAVALAIAGLAPAAGVSYTFTPAARAIAALGLAPSLATTVAAAPAALSLSAHAPSVAVSVASPAGALVLATHAPSAERSYTFAVPAAALSLTGRDPVAVSGDHRLIDVGPAALGLAGAAPTVAVSDHRAFAPGPAALSAAGLAPTVAVSDHRAFAPGVVSLALGGLPPVVAVSDHRAFAPGVVSLALGGLIPTIAVSDHRAFAPGAPTVAFAGPAPTVAVSDHRAVSPGAAAVAFAGAAPTVARTESRFIDVGAAALSATGIAPSLVFEGAVSPDAVAIAFAGRAPSVGVSYSRDVSQTALGIAGAAPVALATNSHFVDVPAGQLTATGQEPSRISGDSRSIGVGAATLALGGLAPVALATNSHFVDVPAGGLGLVGASPVALATNSHFVDVPAGGLGLVGASPLLPQAGAAYPGSVGLALVGLTPVAGISPGIATPLGSIALSGRQPSTSLGGVVPVSWRLISLDEYSPTLAVSNLVERQPSAGAVALEGRLPAVELSNMRVADVPAGAASFHGVAPGVVSSEGRWIDVPPRALALEGRPGTVDVVVNVVVGVPVGALVAGAGPVSVEVLTHPHAVPGAVDLSLVGHAPDSTATIRVYAFPGAVALAVVGDAPAAESSSNLEVQVGVATATVEGRAPGEWAGRVVAAVVEVTARFSGGRIH